MDKKTKETERVACGSCWHLSRVHIGYMPSEVCAHPANADYSERYPKNTPTSLHNSRGLCPFNTSRFESERKALVRAAEFIANMYHKEGGPRTVAEWTEFFIKGDEE